MMEYKIVKLKFLSSLHIGSDRQGIGKESVNNIIHSDTIFSAIVNNYAQIVQSDQEKIKRFIEEFSINIRISSGFPLKKRENDVDYYFPVPRVFPKELHAEYSGDKLRKKIKYAKELKRKTYIDSDNFLKWVQGNSLSEDMESLPKEERLYVTEIRPQNTNDRLTQAASIFHIGLLHFKTDAGMFFVIERNTDSEISWNDISGILRLCGINGIGGRRTSGIGQFEFELTDADEKIKKILMNTEGNSYLNLSTYFPDEEEALHPISYDIIPRKGWMYSATTNRQMKRKTCNMFSEGSIFRNKPTGKIADLTPDGFGSHKIYRFGKPLCIKFNHIEK